jgi:hypothetical protein
MQTDSPCQAVQTGMVRGHSKGLLIIKRCARLFISFLVSPPAVLSVEFTGRAVVVMDGDTIKVTHDTRAVVQFCNNRGTAE